MNGIARVMGDTQLGIDLLSLGKEEPRDKKQLKDLLIVHLDLIQHQQEVILSKDRLIQSLRSERDTVCCSQFACRTVFKQLYKQMTVKSRRVSGTKCA